MKNTLCIECSKNERMAGQRVCTVCHASYMRDYRRTTREKLITRARHEGFEAVMMKLKGMGHAEAATAAGAFSSYTFPVKHRA